MLTLLKNVTILYVEDDDKTREQVSEILKLYSDDVITASNGLEAMEIYNSFDVQLIITDIEMPKLNGIDFIKKVRDKDIQTPIIVTTAYATTSYLLPCANLNIQGYMVKPLLYKTFQETLENVLKYIKMDHYIQLGNNLYFDRDANLIIKNGEKIKLTKEERLLLELLLANKNSVTTYTQIENEIWEQDGKNMTNAALRTVVKKLRQKCGDKELIQNISKMGYKITNNL